MTEHTHSYNGDKVIDGMVYGECACGALTDAIKPAVDGMTYQRPDGSWWLYDPKEPA